jgi:hypothetical protein
LPRTSHNWIPNDLVREFRTYYGPTMNAFEAAEKAGRADDLERELNAYSPRKTKARVTTQPQSPQRSYASP